jgi:hypothetical protein
MGRFIGGSAIPGAAADQVRTALEGLAAPGSARNLDEDLGTLSIEATAFAELNGNTTVVYHDGYVEWDEASKYRSKSLERPAISFHLHDGDLWMFVAYSALPVAVADTATSIAGPIGTLVLAGGLGLWALALAAIGTKFVHELSWGRTVLVLLWVPVLVLAFVAAIFLVES